MKKVILSLVFVLATGTMMNAKNMSVDAIQDIDCDQFANVSQAIVLMNGGSYGDSLIAFDNAYSGCVDYNIDNLIEMEEPEEFD
ncbi:hypothetical protein [Polaribacter marinaquae]|uniref:TMhelix containing protein n=1 Tax=Polaribacter marinaquae TaxID=1642819 RepID=A0ABZ2TNW5_9FLAO